MSAPPGGSDRPGRPKMVACPACGASLTLRALGQSVTVACPSCGSLIDVTRPDIQLIRKYTEQTRQLRIPLGTRGHLRGQLWQLIGAMQRSAVDAAWEEYLLFNPYLGFRWLVYADGRWSLGRMLRDTAALHPEKGQPYQGHLFERLDSGTVTVGWVVGEFYWRVTTGEQVLATDFAAPPLMLSREKSGNEVVWTLLEYLQPLEVETAFRITDVPGSIVGDGARQTDHAWQTLRQIRATTFLALIAAFLLQIIGEIASRSTTIDVGTYDLQHDAADETQIYGPYALRPGHSAAQLLTSAPLDNAWVQLQGSMENTATGQSYRFDDGFQYYHGYDSDGSWHEGASSSSVYLSSLPAGTYNLVVDGISGDQTGRPLTCPVTLKLQLNAVGWRNFWLSVIAILAYPAYLIYQGLRFERRFHQ
ncbi:MAG TPA: DUF4178 domain-containing protein [Steroidobacteraceae bacterium]|nr:DUF4178 domain-containing protein [Steroidobacteraceae bacterium]